MENTYTDLENNIQRVFEFTAAKFSCVTVSQPPHVCPAPGGGTLGISGWGCAARTLQPLGYTRASFSWILLPYTREN